MNILVKSKTVRLSPGFKFDLERRLGRMYRKAARSIRKISVTFNDVNGPKGGNDKQCKLRLTLAGFPSVLIVTQRSSTEKAFVEALKRANRVMFKQIKRRQEFNHQPLYLAAAN